MNRAFINVPIAEASDFHCHSHVTYNLGERSMPSDHVTIRVVVRHCKAHPELDVHTPCVLHHFEVDQ